MNRRFPQLRLIKGGKKSPKPKRRSELWVRFRDFYWEPYVMSLLMVLLLIFVVAALSQLK